MQVTPSRYARTGIGRVWSRIRDPKIEVDCSFDVTVIGDVVAAKGHVQVDRLRAALRNAGVVALR